MVRRPPATGDLRQLDTHGVDTKFIEARKGLFTELLDQILPPDAIVGTFGPRQFEERDGLLCKPSLIRFRMLNENIGGLSVLTVPVTQFAALRTGVERVFVTENEINALAFPPVRSGMIMFGGGYGIERLTGIDWLHDRDVVLGRHRNPRFCDPGSPARGIAGGALRHDGCVDLSGASPLVAN